MGGAIQRPGYPGGCQAVARHHPVSHPTITIPGDAHSGHSTPPGPLHTAEIPEEVPQGLCFSRMGTTLIFLETLGFLLHWAALCLQLGKPCLQLTLFAFSLQEPCASVVLKQCSTVFCILFCRKPIISVARFKNMCVIPLSSQCKLLSPASCTHCSAKGWPLVSVSIKTH